MANRPFSPSSPVSMHNKTSQGWVDNFIQISDQYFVGPSLKLLPLWKKCNLFVGMQEWYIIHREVDFMVSENIHTHPTMEVQSHVAAPSNSENSSPRASKKGKVARGLPPILFFFVGWGWWDVGTHRLEGSLKRKSKGERLTFLKDNISLGKWDSLT